MKKPIPLCCQRLSLQNYEGVVYGKKCYKVISENVILAYFKVLKSFASLWWGWQCRKQKRTKNRALGKARKQTFHIGKTTLQFNVPSALQITNKPPQQIAKNPVRCNLPNQDWMVHLIESFAEVKVYDYEPQNCFAHRL